MMPIADLVVFNANIVTLDVAQPRVTAIASKKGRLIYVGSDAEALSWAAPDAERIDLKGRTIVPGFIDAHLHLLWYGSQLLRQANLVGVASIDELLGRLIQQASRSTGWIEGHGFDQDKLREKRFPTRDDLDRVSSDRPILISRICGHATVANSAALKLLSSDDLAAGDPKTGLFTENASQVFYKRIPPLDETEQEQAGLLATNIAAQAGITCCGTMLDTPDQMGAWHRLHQKKQLPVRIVGMPPYRAVESLHANGIGTGFGDEWVRLGACKLFSDGSLGARTAWLTEPYADDPTTSGQRIYEPEELKRLCRDAQSKGFQIAVHAIGDRAVRETIDALEFALDGASNRSHRHRIEHVSVASPDLVHRMGDLGLLAVVQPQFIKSDSWTSTRLGPDRAAWAYPFASLLRAGAPMALSSDCPVEKMDVIACLKSTTQGRDEALTMDQALHAYCLGSAHAGNVERDLGSLEVGKCADFVVLSEPIADQPDRIGECKVLETYVNGKSASRGVGHFSDPVRRAEM